MYCIVFIVITMCLHIHRIPHKTEFVHRMTKPSDPQKTRRPPSQAMSTGTPLFQVACRFPRKNSTPWKGLLICVRRNHWILHLLWLVKLTKASDVECINQTWPEHRCKHQRKTPGPQTVVPWIDLLKITKNNLQKQFFKNLLKRHF